MELLISLIKIVGVKGVDFLFSFIWFDDICLLFSGEFYAFFVICLPKLASIWELIVYILSNL